MLEQLPELIDKLDERRDLWGEEWDALQAAAAGLEAGSLRAEEIGAFGVLTHAWGEPEAPGPLLARCFLPGAKRYLLAFEREGGVYDYRYERRDMPGPIQSSGRLWHRRMVRSWPRGWDRSGRARGCRE